MPHRLKRAVVAVVGLVAVAAGGAVLGNAATPSPTTATTTNSSGSSVPTFPAKGSAAHEDAEKPVTGDAATKAKAAAVKAVGSGTAGAVTTDYTGDGYEVTVTKADGTSVEVHLDSSFAVMTHGPGGPGGPGRGFGPPPPSTGSI